jgi:hypothetical protein
VWTRNESERAGGTHPLESAERWASEDMERTRASEGTHVLVCSERAISEDMERKRVIQEHTRTGERRAQGQMRAWKEGERARDTHFLESPGERYVGT